jgi:ATP-binding cassette subfamily B protein
MLKRIQERLKSDPHGTIAMIVRVLDEYGRIYWKRYALSFIFMAVAAACTSLSAYLIAHAVNESYIHRNFGSIVLVCVLIFALVAGKGLASYAQAIVLARIGNEITADNQRKLFDKLLRTELGYFSDRHSAQFIGRLAYATTASGGVLTLLITAIGRDSLTLIGLITVMVIQDPLMSAMAIIVMPSAFLLVRSVIRRVQGVANLQFKSNVGIFETMQETVRGFSVIKAFTLEDELRRRAFGQVQDLKRSADALAKLQNQSSPLMEMLGGFAVALLFLYTGYRVVYMNATPGEFFSFIAAFLLAYEPAKRLARLNIGLGQNMVNLRLFYEIVDMPEDSGDASKPSLAVSAGEIEFIDVGFCYRTGEPMLRDMSFVAKAGGVTALVGPSGGGKSTVLNLMLRLYEIDTGKILIDGQDVMRFSRRSVRRQIAFVGQDVFLFRGTIRDNIGFGKPGASEGAIINAARAAHAHDFIMNFPSGYDTPVGEHGQQLSTGQRQRVSIARALLKDAPIILLDEATAALDSESERSVQDAIARLCERRTTIVVAHRLQTIIHADCILFVEHGAVVEAGGHEELLRRAGRYASFYRLQFEGELERWQRTAAS